MQRFTYDPQRLDDICKPKGSFLILNLPVEFRC